MSTLRQLLIEYGLFVWLLVCSALGHYYVSLLYRGESTTISVPLTERESGRTSIAIQLVAAKPKPKLELEEIVKQVTPKDLPKPQEILIAKTELPPEKIITAEIPRPNAPPVMAPPPPPPIEKIEEEKPPEDKPPEPRKRKQVAAKAPVIETIETESEVNIMTKEERGVDIEPRSRFKIEPAYPASLRQANIQGSLELKARIDENGKAQDIVVIQSSGYPEFDASAIEAVKQATFAPATRGGMPVSREVTIPINFKIRGR